MEITRLDYYAALDLTPGADAEQIERAYRFALENYAPDSLAAYGLLSEEERIEVLRYLREAHRTLSDEVLRRNYDKRLVEAGAYAAEQFKREPAPPPSAETAPAKPASAQETAAADEVPAAPARERNWWPFAEKPKTQAPVQAAPPRPDETPRPVPPANLPALDGRPLGGEELRQIREARGLRLDEVSQQTKISLSNLRFLEEGQFKFLPASVYVKGFLRTYAKILRIDADKLIRDYMAVFESHRQA